MPESRDQTAQAADAISAAGSPPEPEAAEPAAESPFDALSGALVDAVIVIGGDGRMQRFNPSAEAMFGYRSAEVLGENVSLLMPEPFRSEHDGYLRSYRQSGVPRIIGIGREVEARRRDGSVFPVDLSVGHARIDEQDVFVGVVRDLTKRRAARAAVDESQRALATFTESLPGMAYRCLNDPARTMRFVSCGSLDLTGYPPEALVEGDVTYADIVHPDDRARIGEVVAAALAAREPFELNYRIRTRSGDERWILERGLGVYSEENDQLRFIEGFIEDVTERFRSVQQLQESETRLRTIIDLVPQLIFAKDENGIFILANRAMAEIYGMTVEQLTGQPQRAIHHIQEEVEIMLAQDRQVIESGRPLTSLEVELTDATGSKRCLQAAKIPFHDAGINRRAVLGVSVDITEQKRASLRLREQDELIQVAFDHTPVAILTSDLDGQVLSANRAATRILGYSREELLTMNTSDFADRELGARIRERLNQVREGVIEEYTEDRSYIRKDGSAAHGRTHASAVHDADGDPVMVVIQFEDNSERRRVEAEADRLRENLAHVGRVGVLGEMATGIAHEINQPLTAISNYAQACRFMLERGTLDEPRFLEILDNISRGAKRAGEVIRRLRTLVRKRESQREPAQINELVADVAALMEVDARLVDLEVDLELDAAAASVNVDKVQIQQVVLNLMRNGMDAMMDVEGEQRRLLVRTVARDESEVEIMVRDRGAGIHEGLDEELFHPFVTTKETGMGMGLSICQSIVDAHGGRLWFVRNGESGTTFHFTLPTTIGGS